MPASPYAWIIDKDHLDDGAEGTCGPRNISPVHERLFAEGHGVKFRMYDGDGDLFYSGRFLGDEDGPHGFAPLDDYGMPNAGCTEIRYWQPGQGGGWKAL